MGFLKATVCEDELMAMPKAQMCGLLELESALSPGALEGAIVDDNLDMVFVSEKGDQVCPLQCMRVMAANPGKRG